jgi:hypothetical protein
MTSLVRDGIWLAIFYGGGLVFWELNVFFRSDYWTWKMVGQGFIWPWLWLKSRRDRRRENRS